MIQLLVIVNIYHPDFGGGGAIFHDMCNALSARGIHVTVQCPYSYYPEWRDKTHQNGWKIRKYKEQGVYIERYGLFIPKQPGSLIQRLLYEFSFFLSLSRGLLQNRCQYDMIMAFCPMAGAVLYALLKKKFTRARLWINVQDFPAAAAVSADISRSGMVNGLLRSIQSFLFNQADLLSTISPVMVKELETMRKKDIPVFYLPNWIPESLNQAILSFSGQPRNPVKDRVRLLYSGNIGQKQGLMRLCLTLHDSDAAFEFNIHADGSGAAEIKEWIDKADDPRFSYAHLTDEHGFAASLHHADFFVITEKSQTCVSFIPSKLLPAIASGTPILAVCDRKSPLGVEICSTRIGLHFSWPEIRQIPERIKNLINCPDAFSTWQRNALNRAGFYNREGAIMTVERLVKKTGWESCP